ncbi:MAG: amidohydrolase family protein [Pseudonocardiaceae bacterium]|nr:amidohydrolase family protein [Pseudonocardiaceae bacterium]
MAVAGGTVIWLGTEESARGRFDGADEVVELHGAFVAAAFVDAHVHATSTGLLLDGLDLTRTTSLRECLDTVARHASARPGAVLWGHGWDETSWPEARPPSRTELDRAAAGTAVYLSRIDAHSAAVSSALLVRAPDAVRADGWSSEGPLSREAHHPARRAARESITPAQRTDAQRMFLTHAAARGVAVVHECAGPDISGADDLAGLLALDAGVEVIGYWGQPVATSEQATELLAATGAHGLAGDLCCDGAIGSRTAALCRPYADAPGNRGVTYLDADAVAAHLVACSLAGTQAGFHVIGDAATGTVLAGLATAETQLGAAALRARTHRVEHLEMVDAEQAGQLARAGVVASVQPAFDAAWGGPDGMYALRLGKPRAAAMNPFATLERAGMVLAFGSDTPVTGVEPWAAVRAAAHHRTPGSGISPAAAFTAHTRAGYRAGGGTDPLAGTLVPGAPASYAVWDAEPDLASPEAESPRCLRTVHHGRTIFDREGALPEPSRH